MNRPDPPCPVCENAATTCILHADNKTYFRCPRCEVRFLDPTDHPNRDAELAHYELHENDPADASYRKFLAKLFNPLVPLLNPGDQGLDYGAGPGPALAAMFEEVGFAMTLYDPFFHANPAALKCQYDFIVCTETIEHFHNPRKEMDRFARLIRPGGKIALMTCFQTDDERFHAWHYRKDPTHVVFYREETMHYIASRHGWTCDIVQKDVAIMTAPKDRCND